MSVRRLLVTVLAAVGLLFGGGLMSAPPKVGTGQGGAPNVNVAGLLLATPAAAQARKRRRSLMNMLFGRKKVRRRAVKRRRAVQQQRARAAARRKARQRRAERAERRKAARARAARAARAKAARNRKARRAADRSQRRRSATRRAAAPAAATTAAVAATAAATETSTPGEVVERKTVLVVGDFYGGGLAFGLDRSFAPETGIAVDDRTVANSGLVRDDVVDWPRTVRELVDETKPDYVVLQLGSNDRQDLRIDGTNHAPRTPEWDAAYKERIEAIAKVLKETGKPFLWVGVPPVRFRSMNRDFVVFNDWYEAAAKEAGGKFVDVWDGFSDEEGNYVRSGPSVSGQIVLLRGKDGINMTRRGKDKLGWYAAEIVGPALEGPKVYTELPPIDLGTVEMTQRIYNPARSGRTVVVKLDDPKVDDGASGLAGAEPLAPAVPDATVRVPEGRADDFSWPGGPGQTAAGGSG